MIKLIGQFLKILLFFFGLWKEKDREKAEKKAEIAKEIVDAFKESDARIQASHLNVVCDKLNRMHS